MRIAVCDDVVSEQEQFGEAMRGWDPTREAEKYFSGAALLEAAKSAPVFDIAFMIVLRIQNTCGLTHRSREPAGWEEFASGKETGHQGVGLRSVTAIAEKYDGSAQFQCRDGVFTTRVILNPANRQE